MSLESDFYSGLYSKILAASVDSPEGTIAPADAPFVIGSLTFRGRLAEAEGVYDLFEERLSDEGRVTARFFLGVNLCRHSRDERGLSFLNRNLREGARSPNARIRFYVWQGLGFYRLVGCRYRDTLRYASRAHAAAIEANFLYGKALASDLMAHSQVGPGQIQAAGESFRRALRYAEMLGDGGLRQAIEISLVIHNAQFGMSPQTDIQDLEALVASMTSEDSYSKGRLLLEIGRQYTLRGQLKRARQALDRACRSVHGSQNRRDGIALNMRYAHLHYLAGEFHQALNLVRNASKELDPRIDIGFTAEVAGLEHAILDAIGCATLDREKQASAARAASLGQQTGRAINLRIEQRRDFGSYSKLGLMGDDPLGDIIDLSHSRLASATHKIMESGFLLFLMTKLRMAPGKSVLILDPVPGALVACDSGEIHLADTGVTNVIRSLVQRIASGDGSKESLIRHVWKYDYKPLKHDQLIYAAVSRLRQLLGPQANWLEASDEGYRFLPHIEVRVAAELVEEVDQKEPPADRTDAPAGIHAGLNYRQISILERMTGGGFVDARTCSEWFQVSEVSARRDLAQLTNLGMLRRHGRGRATRYASADGSQG